MSEEPEHFHSHFPFTKYFLRHRKIYLWGSLEECNSLFTVGALEYLREKNKEPIYLYINSPGGEVVYMAAILDEMNKVKKDGISLYTVVIGEACSAACVLLMNGSEGCRIARPQSVMMAHQIEYSLDLENASKNKRITEFVHRQNDDFIQLMANLCMKTTASKLKKFKEDITGGDLWFNAKEALKYGIIDSIADI